MNQNLGYKISLILTHPVIKAPFRTVAEDILKKKKKKFWKPSPHPYKKQDLWIF